MHAIKKKIASRHRPSFSTAYLHTSALRYSENKCNYTGNKNPTNGNHADVIIGERYWRAQKLNHVFRTTTKTQRHTNGTLLNQPRHLSGTTNETLTLSNQPRHPSVSAFNLEFHKEEEHKFITFVQENKGCFHCTKRNATSKCSSCHIAVYCDRQCQKANWNPSKGQFLISRFVRFGMLIWGEVWRIWVRRVLLSSK